MDALKQGADALFILLGGIMVLAMHAGFAFLELGTVRKKNQVNALVKILVDFSVSTIAYFVVGYGVAYGTSFFVGAETLAQKNGYDLVKFFFLLTFAAAIPAIISGGIAERAKFWPQLIATAVIVGWFGFNVMSAQRVENISGLVAVNSLMAMVGGTIAALLAGKNDPGFVHNGPLAGLVAVCAGSDIMHPLGALVVGAVAGVLFVVMFTATQNRWKIDDVLGVWPLHGLCGTWGGIAAGIFGQQALGGLGNVSFTAQLIGTALGVTWALLGGVVVYGVLKATLGLRLDQEEEYDGADLTVHKISATPDREVSW